MEPLLTLLGIGVPGLLLVAVIRRWFEPVSWRLAAMLLAIVLASLHLAVFTSAMPLALDEVVRGYPYRGIFGDVVSRNPDTNDTVKQMLPWMQVVREELFALRAPLWNRYSFSGYPLLGNGQSAPFSPFFLSTLFVTLPKQIVAMAGLKLFAGLLFGVLYLRREGLGAGASLFGSIVFSLSIIQNVYLYYPLSAVTFLLPALAWGIIGAFREGRNRDLVALAVIVASAFAAGHPETVLLLALAGAILLAIEVAAPSIPQRRSCDAVGRTLLAATLGVLLSAPAWFPVAEQILGSQRLGALHAGEVGSPRYPAQALWLLLNPDGYGNPARGNWSWIFHYIMVAPTYVGLLPLALLPGALFSRGSDRRTRLFGAAAVIVLLIALRWTLLGEWFNRLPLAEWSANDRLRFVMVFFVAVAASRRLQQIQIGARWGWDLIASFLVGGAAAWVFSEKVGATLEPVHLVGVVSVGFFWIALVAVKRRLPAGRSWIGAAAALAVAIELWIFNLPFNALTDRRYFAPPLPIIDAIHRLAPEEPFRVLGRDWVFLPNASAHYGLEDIRGSDPLAWRPYTEFFRLIQAEGQSLDVGRVYEVDHPAVDFLNVRFLMAEPDAEMSPAWSPVYRGVDGALFENREWLHRFYAPRRLVGVGAGEVDIEKLRSAGRLGDQALVEGVSRGEGVENPQPKSMWLRRMKPGSFRMTVDAPASLFIASSEPALPGWRVEVGGKRVPIRRVNGAFLGFDVPAGISRVRVSYEPASFRAGVVAGALGALTFVMIARRRRSVSLPLEE